MRFTVRSLGLVPWLLAAIASAALPAPEQVSFPSLDRNPDGVPVTISARYFRPPGTAPDREIPLVIALHGCGGMFSARAERRNELSERFANWTELLLAEGYAVLWPDSLNPRGRREICTIKTGERTIRAAARRLDVLGALDYGAALPGVDRDRIALMGWSHGGSTTLATVNALDPQVAGFRGVTGTPPRFRTAVAFYPGCEASLRAGASWKPAVPVSIHIGEADDWTPAAPCVELGRAAQARGDPVTVTVYAGSYHGFDAPRGRVAVRRDVPNGVHPGQGVTVGPNAAARAATIAAVRAALRQSLQPLAAGLGRLKGTDHEFERYRENTTDGLKGTDHERLQDAGSQENSDVDDRRRHPRMFGPIDFLRNRPRQREAGNQRAH